ncbi:MAG: PTS sugar transporter subunit IIA [Treponema sp.]|jgi:PTS system nitrogen regulatory IIA component|nr:PTS sugar transporter subunit IIA [Treponema sp.]
MIDDDILTLGEVAKYLKVSERTVYEWAQKGEIPAGKIGTVWRFKKAELEEWVNERLSAYKLNYQGENIQPEAIFSVDRIVFLNHSSKRDALFAMIENISTAPQIKNRQELAHEILRREDLMSTAIGRGIAIPHIRLSSITDMVVSVGLSQVDIGDFQTLDDEPVRILFMIAAAYNQHSKYLQTLSYFAAHLKNSGLRSALLAAKNAQEAYGILIGM